VRLDGSNAQHLADSITSAYPNTDPAKQIRAFDVRLSQWYIGAWIGTSYASAVAFFAKTSGSHFEGGDLNKVSERYFGAEDFPDKFKDNPHGQIDLGADQTHHFVAYLSAGLNNQSVAAINHMQADASSGNTGDVGLGSAAYGMGQYILQDPAKLNHIGEYIWKYICNGETPPFETLK
jgi:hypothetical protein